MGAHDWLTEKMRSLHWIAHYLREALEDGSLLPAGRNAVAAAAKYLLEWEDMIPDTDPKFGYIDDLFVTLYGLDQLLHKGGRQGKAYGERALPSGDTLAETIIEGKRTFAKFWTRVQKEVAPGFQNIARELRKDKQYTEKLCVMLDNYIEAYGKAPRPLEPITAADVDEFRRKHAS